MLQQTSTFRPFVRKLIMFFEVALRASKHDVRYIVASFTRKRNYMLNMVDVLAPLFLELGISARSIVAFIFLPLQLFLNLFGCVVSSTGMFEGTPSVHIAAANNRVGFGVGFAVSTHFFRMLLIVSISIFLGVFFVGSVPRLVIGYTVFPMGLMICLCLLFMSLMIGFLACPAFFFVCFLPRFRDSAFASTHFWTSKTRFFSLRTSACFALGVKPIFPILSMTMKKFEGCRKPLLAWASALLFRGVFGYDVIHDTNLQFVSSRPWMFAASQGQNIFFNFTTKHLLEQYLPYRPCPYMKGVNNA